MKGEAAPIKISNIYGYLDKRFIMKTRVDRPLQMGEIEKALPLIGLPNKVVITK